MENELKQLIIETLDLEDIGIDDIDSEAALLRVDTLGAGMYSNQLFDTAPSTTYPALAVADTFESHATDGVGSYYVEMTAPPEDKCSSTWHAEIPRELYQGIVAGHTKLRVDVKPGAFGFPWVKKVSIVK